MRSIYRGQMLSGATAGCKADACLRHGSSLGAGEVLTWVR
jgi:hypothetical protein